MKTLILSAIAFLILTGALACGGGSVPTAPNPNGYTLYCPAENQWYAEWPPYDSHSKCVKCHHWGFPDN
jgi:ABC-type glycerol-3-phosphate transport system substrate-binding protein